jgi:hypothetical protein
MSHANIIYVGRRAEKTAQLILRENWRGVDNLAYLAQRSERGGLWYTVVNIKASEYAEI